MFCIGLHKKDVKILESIQSSLGVGKIHKHSIDSLQLRVGSLKELDIIIDHFTIYPLKSERQKIFFLSLRTLFCLKNVST